MRGLLTTLIACALMGVGCQQEIDIDPPHTNPYTSNTGTGLFASFADESTRVYLGDDYYFRWELGNSVSVFLNDTQNREYVTEKADVIISPLTAVDGEGSVEATNNKYAIFPYRPDNEIEYLSDGGCVIRSYIDAVQQYRSDAINLDHALMVSKAAPFSNIFTFRNSCALVKINIKTTEKYVDIAHINCIVVGSRYRNIAGPVVINMADDFTAHIDNNSSRAGERTNTITLSNSAEAGLLNTEFKSFFIAIPAEEYQAGDLTIQIDASDDRFDHVAVIKNAYSLRRSEYIELFTILDPDKKNSWVEDDEDDGDFNIKDDATLVNTSIMTHAENLVTQGFYGQDQIQTMLPIPSGDYTVDGEFLVQGNNHTINFTATGIADFVMNTFTTNKSGFKGVTPPTVTVNDLTITGELRCTTLGIYCHNWMPMYNNRADQAAFSTIWNNVNVLNNRIVSYTQKFGSAVIVYGKAVLNNCHIYGTERSSLENPPIAPNIYDMFSVNNSNTIINGGRFGKIGTTEHTEMTINHGAEVETLMWGGINNARPRNMLTINRAHIGSLVLTNTNEVVSFERYPPRIRINSEAVIDVLDISIKTKTSRMVIEQGAQIGKVVVVGNEMTMEQFIERYNVARE